MHPPNVLLNMYVAAGPLISPNISDGIIAPVVNGQSWNVSWNMLVVGAPEMPWNNPGGNSSNPVQPAKVPRNILGAGSPDMLANSSDGISFNDEQPSKVRVNISSAGAPDIPVCVMGS